MTPRQPRAAVRDESPSLPNSAIDALQLLLGDERLKAVCSELVAALEALEPAEPDNPAYAGRHRQALESWASLAKKSAPRRVDYAFVFDHTLTAALATQTAPAKKESTIAAKATAFSPASLLGSVYKRRRSSK